MTDIEQRDIVWVRVPYSDLQRSKARPAVVVSRDTYHDQHPDVVVCAVTSNLEPSPWKIPLTPETLEEGELPLESMARADKVLPVEKRLVDDERILGTLSPEAHDRVLERVQTLLARPED